MIFNGERKNARKMSISKFAARSSSDADDIESNVMYDALPVFCV